MNKKKSSKTCKSSKGPVTVHGDLRAAEDVTVTVPPTGDPPSGGVTCAPATGRRGEPGKGKSKTDNRCRVCCGDGQYWTGAVVLRRWKGVQEVFAPLECLVEYQQAPGVEV